MKHNADFLKQLQDLENLFSQLILKPKPKQLASTALASWERETQWLRVAKSKVSQLRQRMSQNLGPSNSKTETARSPGAASHPTKHSTPATSGNTAWQMQFMSLQRAITNDSRMFQALSNTYQSRHDDAMKAIRDIKA